MNRTDAVPGDICRHLPRHGDLEECCRAYASSVLAMARIRECHVSEGYAIGAADGAAVAFGLMGMAEAIREAENERAIRRVIESCDWSDEDPGDCGQCGARMELVRPGKSQPTCGCWDEEKVDDAADDASENGSTHLQSEGE